MAETTENTIPQTISDDKLSGETEPKEHSSSLSPEDEKTDESSPSNETEILKDEIEGSPTSISEPKNPWKKISADGKLQ